MDNDSGRGSRSNEPPKLATVRRLHIDDGEGSSATATEEWYETERLTGHITGRRNAPAVEPIRDEALLDLDWRHADSAPPPTALQRLGRSLAAHGHRVASLFVLAGHRRHGLAAAGARNAAVPTQPKARRPRLTMLSTRRAAAPPTVDQHEDKPTADQVLAAEPSSPRTAPRSSADLAPQRLDWRSAPAPKTRRDRRPRPWALGLIGAALVVTAAAAAVIAITSSPNGRDSHRASFAAATSIPRVALIAGGKTVIGVLGSVEHQTRTTPARQRNIARRADPRRRPHHAQQRHSRPAHPHTSSPAPHAPAALPATSSTSGSSISTGASNSQNSAASSASGSQSTSSASAASQSQPAGPTGPASILGPGHCSC